MGFKWLLNVINSKFVSYSAASNAITWYYHCTLHYYYYSGHKDKFDITKYTHKAINNL